MPSTQRCSKCGETKSLDEFHRDRRRPLGRRSDCRACQREYYRTWSEANSEYFREYYAANRDRRREHYAANRDRYREYKREHYAANRDRYHEYERRRRARKRAATVEEFSPDDVYAWWEELGLYTCFWCGLPFTEDDRIHVDHVWPLSRGGHHAVRNLVPACERCNRAKSSALPHEFAERAYGEWLASTSE